MQFSTPLRIMSPVQMLGFSMFPLFRNEDFIYFRKILYSSIQPSDVIVIRKDKKIIIHRVVYFSKKYLITKGDSKNYSDGKILPQQIIGIVYQIKRGNGIFPVESLSFIQNTSYLREMVLITSLFQKNNVDFVFLKGLPITLYYTKDMPKRIFADCDILVAEKDYQRAKNLLNKNGFRQQKSIGLFSKFLAPHLMEEDFLKRNPYPVMIDLHKRPFSYIRKLDLPDSLYPKKYMDEFIKELFQKRRWVLVNGIKIPIPQKDYLLIFLTIHFFTHTMKMVHRLWLIKEVIKKDYRTIGSWQPFLEKANRFQMGFMIYPALYFINKLYESLIPQYVIKQIKPRGEIRKIYKLKTDLVFDERVNFSRVYNKFYISWVFSPQSFHKKIRLFFAPSLFLLALTYIRQIHTLITFDFKRVFLKMLRNIKPIV